MEFLKMHLGGGTGLKSIQRKQYIIRNVPKQVDEKLRQRSRVEGKSLNDVVLEALVRGLSLPVKPSIHTDLDAIIGCWKDDPAFDESIRDQHFDHLPQIPRV